MIVEKPIEALRNCAGVEPSASCSKCSYVNQPHCRLNLMRHAADTLEALQARADKQDAEITDLLAVITKNDTEMDNLKTELLNAQDEAKYERQRLRLCEENLEATMASETTYREMCDALQAQMPKWISAEDRLPLCGQDVLAARLYGSDAGGWSHEVIIAHTSNVRDSVYWNATNVTHWMPFPQKPKGEQEGEQDGNAV